MPQKRRFTIDEAGDYYIEMAPMLAYGIPVTQDQNINVKRE